MTKVPLHVSLQLFFSLNVLKRLIHCENLFLVLTRAMFGLFSFLIGKALACCVTEHL